MDDVWMGVGSLFDFGCTDRNTALEQKHSLLSQIVECIGVAFIAFHSDERCVFTHDGVLGLTL